MKTLSAIIIITFFSAAVFAQAAGDLDSTFSGDGKVKDWFPWQSYSGNMTAIAIQPDGKILVAGTMHVSGFSPYRWFIWRYNPDGLLDNSFGSGGMIISGGETSAVVFSLSVQQDWKIVAGECNSDYYSVVRYNTDGSFDTSFAVNSYFESFIEQDLALQSDGKIVVGGFIYSNAEFRLTQYTSNGILDSSFNSIGFVTTAIGLSSAINSLTIQSDGKIVAAGGSYSGANTEFALARYNPNGTLDSSFSQDGIVTTAIDSTYGINSIAPFNLMEKFWPMVFPIIIQITILLWLDTTLMALWIQLLESMA